MQEVSSLRRIDPSELDHVAGGVAVGEPDPTDPRRFPRPGIPRPYPRPDRPWDLPVISFP